MIPYIITDQSITVVVKGKPYTISQSNASFNEVRNRLQNGDFKGIEQLFDQGAAVASFTKGNVVVDGNEVLYKGKPVANYVVDKILQFMREGLPYKPLVAFLNNLLNNPSFRAVQELYAFLEVANLPITEDGCFLAFRKVRDDYKDFYTGKNDNSIGAVVEMARCEVNEDKNQTCSYGLHFCSHSYLPHYHGGQGRVVIVKINPADVVSIPADYNNAKGRCCRYEVIADCDGHDNGQQFGVFYGNVKPVDELTEADETEAQYELYDVDEDERIQASYQEGYQCGNIAAANGTPRDAELAFDFATGDLDEDAFTDGYHAGYDDYVVAPVAKVTKAKATKTTTISEATRKKLRRAAKRQKRGANGKFI